MMITSILVAVVVLGIALPPTEACTYWCMNPKTRNYDCCDGGNPWHQGDSEEPAAENIEDEVVDSGTVMNVDSAGSSGCLYYCNYNSQVYCCDNGEGIREYFIPQYHVPQYIGPHVMETLPPEYIVQTVPGYDSISQTNPFGLLTIVDEDTEEETRDSGSFPFNIASIFRNPLSAIFNSGDETSESSQDSNYGRFIDHVMNSPTLGRLAFDSLMSIIPSVSAEERAETSKSLDESNLDKRQVDVDDVLNPTFSINRINSLSNGEDDNSKIRGSKNTERGEIDFPILSPVPLINSFVVSIPSGENSFSGGVPLVPSDNSFASSSPDINSELNSQPLLFVVKNSVSEEVPLVSINNSFTSNFSNANLVSKGVPLMAMNNSLSVLETMGTTTNSSGVPLISLNNVSPDLNQLKHHKVSNTQNTDISQRLPNTQGIPLPFIHGQANTAFVMQHILQQPEMANAVIHSQQSTNPLFIATNGSLQENTIEAPHNFTEESSNAELPLHVVATENHLKTIDALGFKGKLSTVPTLPIIVSEENLNIDVTSKPVILIDSNTSFTLSHPILSTQTENPSIPEMYDTFPTPTVPKKQSNHGSINYPSSGSLQGQQFYGSIPFSSIQQPFSPYPPQKKGYSMPSTKQNMRPIRPFIRYQTPKSPHGLTYDPPPVRVTPDFILTGSDTPGIPSVGLTPPSKGFRFFSHIPASITDKLIAPPKESISADGLGDFVKDEVLDLVMNINKATCLCLESDMRRNDTSCPCSIEDLVVVFPPTPLQPYLLLPLSKSESFVEKHTFDNIEKGLSEEELITSPSEYSIQKISQENKRINVSKENSEAYPKQKQQIFLEVLKRFHNLSNQIHKRTLADILGNSSKLPKVGIDNDQIEEIIHSESSSSSKFIPSSSS